MEKLQESFEIAGRAGAHEKGVRPARGWLSRDEGERGPRYVHTRNIRSVVACLY